MGGVSGVGSKAASGVMAGLRASAGALKKSAVPAAFRATTVNGARPPVASPSGRLNSTATFQNAFQAVEPIKPMKQPLEALSSNDDAGKGGKTLKGTAIALAGGAFSGGGEAGMILGLSAAQQAKMTAQTMTIMGVQNTMGTLGTMQTVIQKVDQAAISASKSAADNMKIS